MPLSLERARVSNSIMYRTESDSPRLFANDAFVATDNLVTQHFALGSGQNKVCLEPD